MRHVLSTLPCPHVLSALILMMWLSLSYHRRLRVISETLELYVEGGRVSHSWPLLWFGWVRAGMKVVDGMHVGQSRGVGRMPGDAGALPECEVIH